MHVQQPHEAVEEQASPREQRQRQRELGDDEPGPSRVCASGSADHATAGVVIAREDKDGRGADDQPDDDRDEDRKAQHGGIRLGLRESWHVRADADQDAEAEHAHHQSRDRAGSGHEQALGDQQARDARAGAAEHRADRELALAIRGADEREAGDVGDRDQQHQRDGAPENAERLARITEDALAERRRSDAR